MRPVTAGERLFRCIRDDAFNSIGDGEANWANFSRLLEYSTGHEKFSSYVRGAASIFAMRRLLRFWEVEKYIVDTNNEVKSVSNFLHNDVFPGIGDPLKTKLARLVIEAVRSSHRTISDAVRRETLDGKVAHNCYLCGRPIVVGIELGPISLLTLEHLWPQSLGGDSIVENLLPACLECQIVTKDAASWEWLNIHNLVLKSEPSNNALTSVFSTQRFARHYLSVIETCDEFGLTLKQGFLRIGPIKKIAASKNRGRPTTFFELTTHE